MPDITIRLPWGDPLTPILLKLVDQGDGTHAPQVSSEAAGGVSNPLTEDLDADGHAITNASNLPTLLVDPGNVWAAVTVVAEGYRIAQDNGVFEAPTAGTTGTEPPEWDFTGANEFSDGTAGWIFRGWIGNPPVALSADYMADAIARGMSAQTVPQTNPSVQDVIDVLVAAFGLVQSD